uniref:Uncharacterized protein n=1 Tax=Amphimedon queenslandica TaxID=400682 RepID=A0A1X7VQH7_AMPQE
MVWSQTIKEPMVNVSSSSDRIRADVDRRDVWQPKCTCFFDVRVIDKSHEQIIETGEREKSHIQ